jgi:hypothetical protein
VLFGGNNLRRVLGKEMNQKTTQKKKKKNKKKKNKKTTKKKKKKKTMKKSQKPQLWYYMGFAVVKWGFGRYSDVVLVSIVLYH